MPCVEDKCGTEALLHKIAPSEQGTDALSAAVRVLSKIDERRNFPAFVVLAQNKVNDASDGVATVDR